MSEIQAGEIPLVFDCGGETLVGIVHRPAEPSEIGVVTVVAGGPQYRAGVGRGMVSLARELAANGVPVMRFDHRGLGDSSGDFLGFEHLAEDLQAAIAAFRSEVPQVREIVLWGGCDAASGVMIHAWKIPEVTSLVVGNPFVSSAVTQVAVLKQHYRNRLGEWSFWRKLFRFEYNLLDYAGAGLKKMTARLSRATKSPVPDLASAGDAASQTFIDRMLDGLQRFNGSVLFLMSGQSLVSKEFDELLSRDPVWQEAYNRPVNRRLDLPDADQTFSGGDSRERMNQAVCEWVEELSKT